MTFYHEDVFFLFIPLAILFLYLFYKYKKNKTTLQWSRTSPLVKLSSTLRVLLSPTLFILQVISIILIIFALARPQKIDMQTRRSMEGIDIMVLFDISFSMEVNDMNPGTRIDSAKAVVNQFIEGLNSDRVGIVLFSGEAYTKIPLTLDYDLLKNTISQIKTSPDIKKGTAIGVATATAISRLRHSKSRSKVIILITDGENNTGEVSPKTAVSIAKNYGIKIYSIGVGSKKRVRIPVKIRDHLGKESIIYTQINSQINTKLLGEMSKATGGQFYLAKNLQTLNQVFEEISQLEKSVIETRQWLKITEQFQIFLKPAFWLYLIFLILSFTFFGRVL